MFGLNATQACLVQRWHKEVGWYTTACSSGPAVNAHRLPWRHRGAQPISESDSLKPSVAARRPGQTKSCLVWQKSGSVRQSCTYQRCYGRNHRLWDYKHARSCRCRLFSHEKYHPWILFRCSGSIHPNKTKSRGGIAYQSMHLCTLCKHDASCRLQSQQAPPVPGLQKKKKRETKQHKYWGQKSHASSASEGTVSPCVQTWQALLRSINGPWFPLSCTAIFY